MNTFNMSNIEAINTFHIVTTARKLKNLNQENSGLLSQVAELKQQNAQLQTFRGLCSTAINLAWRNPYTTLAIVGVGLIVAAFTAYYIQHQLRQAEGEIKNLNIKLSTKSLDYQESRQNNKKLQEKNKELEERLREQSGLGEEDLQGHLRELKELREKNKELEERLREQSELGEEDLQGHLRELKELKELKELRELREKNGTLEECNGRLEAEVANLQEASKHQHTTPRIWLRAIDNDESREENRSLKNNVESNLQLIIDQQSLINSITRIIYNQIEDSQKIAQIQNTLNNQMQEVSLNDDNKFITQELETTKRALQEQESEINTLQRANQELQGQLEEQETQLKQQSDELLQRERALEEKDAELQQAQNELETSKNQLSQLQGQLKEKESEINTLQQTNQGLQEQIEDLQAQKKDLEERLRELKENEQALRERSALGEVDLQGQLREKDAKLTQLTEQLRQKEQELRELQGELQNHSDELQELQGQLQARNEELERKLKQQSDELRSKIEEFSQLQDQLQQSAEQNQALQAQLQEQLQQANINLEEQERALEEKDAELQRAQNELETSKNQLSQLQGQLKEKENEINTLQQTNQGLQEQLQQREEEFTSIKEEKEALQTQAEEYQNQIEQKKEKIARIEEDKANQINLNQELNQKITDLTEELVEAKQELQSTITISKKLEEMKKDAEYLVRKSEEERELAQEQLSRVSAETDEAKRKYEQSITQIENIKNQSEKENSELMVKHQDATRKYEEAISKLAGLQQSANDAQKAAELAKEEAAKVGTEAKIREEALLNILSGRIADINKVLCEVHAKQEETFFEVKKISDVAKQKAEGISDLYEKTLYLTLQWELISVYTAALAVNTEIVPSNKTGIIGDVGKLLEEASSYVPVVGVGVKFFSQLLKSIDQKQQSAMVNHYATLVCNYSAMEVLAENVADKILMKVRNKDLDMREISAHRDSMIERCINMITKQSTWIVKNHEKILNATPVEIIGGAAAGSLKDCVIRFFDDEGESTPEENEAKNHAKILAIMLISKIYTGENIKHLDAKFNEETLIKFIDEISGNIGQIVISIKDIVSKNSILVGVMDNTETKVEANIFYADALRSYLANNIINLHSIMSLVHNNISSNSLVRGGFAIQVISKALIKDGQIPLNMLCSILKSIDTRNQDKMIARYAKMATEEEMRNIAEEIGKEVKKGFINNKDLINDIKHRMINVVNDSIVLLNEYKVKGSVNMTQYGSGDNSEIGRAYDDAALITEMLLIRIDPDRFIEGDVQNNQSLVFEALYDIMGVSEDKDERISIGSIIDDMSTVSSESHRGPRVFFMSLRKGVKKGSELLGNWFRKQLGIESVAKEIGEQALQMSKEILCNGNKVDSYDIQEEFKLLDGINTELMKKSRVQQVLIVSEIVYDNPILNNSNIGDILVNTYREGGMTAIDAMLSNDTNTLQITIPDNLNCPNEGITWHERTAKNPSNTHYCNI